MFAKLKKLVGADEEGKARRQAALEQEQREREQRIAAGQAALKKNLEAEHENKPQS